MPMPLESDFGTGEVFWSILWFTLFFMWIWLVIIVFSDVFRSRDLSGWAKALWTVFIVFLPYLGVLVYLIARGSKMAEHAQHAAMEQEAATRSYIQSVAGSSSGSAADEIARLADLRDKGVLSEEEFQAAKARALS
jgi:Short C-terminal domain/Phospholipase_D-nuclease N-terminal